MDNASERGRQIRRQLFGAHQRPLVGWGHHALPFLFCSGEKPLEATLPHLKYMA